jgi:Leucine-rich repeat (LRR) protein
MCKATSKACLHVLFGLTVVLAIPSCQDGHWYDSVATSFSRNSSDGLIQKGAITLRDGEERKVYFQSSFDTPPRVTVTGINQSWFKKEPYRKDDFQILRLDATGFTVQSNHHEPGSGAWATIEWQAEGTRRQGTTPTKREQLADLVKRRGGQLTGDVHAPGAPVIGIDLHKTRISDDELALVEGVTTLRTLNLYGTKISDAGLAHIAGLVSLRTLYLNDTAISDQGLAYLQRLTGLQELGLNHTRITDAGLAYLRGLTSLQKLSLAGTRITDQGVPNLQGLRNLKELFINSTGVTDAGVQQLKQALPRTAIIR